MRKISEGILTFGFVGRLPAIPGTWGSLATLAICLSLPTAWSFHAILGLSAVIFFFLGWFLSRDVEAIFGRSDPGPVVLDEVVGMLIALMVFPRPEPAWMVLAFFLFRFFDIVKPFPVRQAERIPGGLGIFLDDVLAGLYTNAIIHMLFLIL